MEIENFEAAFKEWLEKSQDYLIKSDWEAVSKDYPFVACGADEEHYTKFKRKLKFCRVCLVTGGALYLREKQEPFSVTSFEGDFSYRAIPRQIFTDDIEICHEYTSTRFARQDVNVLFPLERFKKLEEAEIIGEFSERHFSIYDFIPQASKIGESLAGPLVEELVQDEIDVALFFPVCELGHQTMTLLQREAERKGITTLSFATNPKALQRCVPPRAVVSDYPDGAPLGEPNNPKAQQELLKRSLDFLTGDQNPGGLLETGYTWHDPYL